MRGDLPPGLAPSGGAQAQHAQAEHAGDLLAKFQGRFPSGGFAVGGWLCGGAGVAEWLLFAR